MEHIGEHTGHQRGIPPAITALPAISPPAPRPLPTVPTTRVKQHVITAIVDGHPRHRILGLELRYGQTLSTLDGLTSRKVARIASRYGLSVNQMQAWWWYVAASDQEPVPDHRLKRGDVVIAEGDRGGAQFSSLQDPLAFYFHRGLITARQRRAGEKLYQLWRYGNMLSHWRVMRYDDSRGGYSDPQASALLSPEYRKAMDAIKDRSEREVAFGVCCECRVLAELEGFKSARSAQRHSMGRLRNALDALADHFKFGEGTNGPHRDQA